MVKVLLMDQYFHLPHHNTLVDMVEETVALVAVVARVMSIHMWNGTEKG